VHEFRDMEQTRVTGAQTIVVVLPCYKSKQHVLDVIARIGPEIALIVAVDDACPMGTGAHIEQNCRDPRLVVVRNETNLGVGGAVMRGYQVAKGADIVVKIDSDGQMDPAFLPTIVRPILEGIADYTKGNRFFNIEDRTRCRRSACWEMPASRSSPSCRAGIGTFSIRPTATPRSTASRWSCCRSARSIGGSSSSPTCCFV
jgi:glycosyltransferase involved in cell wall biosynthesis